MSNRSLPCASPGELPPATQLLQASGKASPPEGHIYPMTLLGRRRGSRAATEVQMDLLDLAGVLPAVRRRGLAGYGAPQGPNFLMRTAGPSRRDRKSCRGVLSVVGFFLPYVRALFPGSLAVIVPIHQGATEEDWAQPRKVASTYQRRLSSLYERKMGRERPDHVEMLKCYGSLFGGRPVFFGAGKP